MLNLKKSFSFSLLVISAFYFTNCDECEEVVPVPVVKSASFTIAENSAEGTLVGTVELEIEEDDVTFAIAAGDPENAFSIDAITGELTIADSAKIDFEKTTDYDLSIEATGAGGHGTAKISIQVSDMTPTISSLAHHYNFQNNANDLVASNDGFLDQVTFLPKNASTNLSANFETSGNIRFPMLFDYPKRTISVWFMITDVNEVPHVIYSCDNEDVEFGMTILSATKDQNTIQLMYNVSFIPNFIPVVGGVWYNSVFVVNDKKFSLFLNGEKFHEQTFTDYIHSGNSIVSGSILGSSRADDRFFDGRIDDLRVYNRALSDREVELIYHEENQF